MTRKFLANLGISDDHTITKILNAHQETVQSLKDTIKSNNHHDPLNPQPPSNTPNPDYDTLILELSNTKNALANEIAAHKAALDSFAAEKDSADTLNLVRSALANDGANPKAIDLLINAVDFSALSKKNGSLENWNLVSKPLRDQFADFFGEFKRLGADVGSPPPSSPSPPDPFLSGFNSI